jgi:hypothetical protein
MGSQRPRDRASIQAAAITAALLTLAVGFCVFDADDGGLDLCLGLMGVSFGVVLAERLTVAGSAVPMPATLAYSVPLHTPDPPPKPTRLFLAG